MGKRPSPVKIGAFVVGAVVLLVGALVTVGTGRFFSHKLPFVLFFDGSVNGLDVGAQVKFRGVPVGQVTDIRLAIPGVERAPSYRIPVFIEIDRDRAAGLGARAVLTDPNRALVLVQEGLRAQLQLQSLITGVLFISLDMMPETPISLVLPPGSGYDEIPTVPTAFEQVQAKVLEVVDRLSTIDFETLGRSLQGAIGGVNKVVNSPDVEKMLASARRALDGVQDVAQELKPRIGTLTTSLSGTSDDARASLKRIDAAVDSLKRVLDPQAPLLQNANNAFADLSEAAQAVRALAQYLDRNPNAVITGRKTK